MIGDLIAGALLAAEPVAGRRELLIGLVNNAALLIALGLLYDVLVLRRGTHPIRQRVGAGIVLGAMGMAVMLNGVVLQDGLNFDTRSIVLAVAGLFFGPVPALISMAMTGALRIYQGGGGMYMGTLVIGVSGLIGIVWRQYRHANIARLTLKELYLFGLVVHLAMLASTLLLPAGQRLGTAQDIALPVLLVYPIATALLGWLMVQRNRTRLAEDELLDTNALLRTVMDNIPSAVFVKDRRGRKLLANRVDVQKVGRPESEVIGRKDSEVYPPDMAARFEAADRQVLETGNPLIDIEESERDEQGNERWMLISKLPLRDSRGRITGLVGIGHDITARKREERRLVRAAEIQKSLGAIATSFLSQMDFDSAVRLLLQELGRLTAACRTYYFAIDPDTGIMSNTHEWCDEGVPGAIDAFAAASLDAFPWFGPQILRCEVIHVPDLMALPDEATADREALRAVGVRSIIIFPIGIKGVCVGFLGITAVRNPRQWDAEEVLLLGLFTTTLSAYIERRNAENDRIDLERQILQTQKLESLGVLAGGIAHDFNNILMAILGHADLALDDLPPLSPARDSIGEIEKAARRAADLCRQMLAYSGRGRFVIERIDLSDLVDEMVHLLRTSITKKALLNLNIEKNLPPLMADATQMRQVLMNLVINASEAIGDRSGVITISTGAMDCTSDYLTETYLDENLAPGLYVWLEVSDTGCGMDRETQSRIFEPFFTTKFTGRGLGMAAVLGIVRGHKGALKVYSEPNKGTTFKVLFPVGEEAVLVTREPGEVDQAEWRGEGLLLLADDEETIRALGKRMLERLGFTVITAADGREAVEIYRERGDEIRAVLLDLTMPHMDGEEAFRALRQIDPGVRVVLSSGYTEHDIVSRFAGKGLAGFMPKPYTMQGLRERLRIVFEPEGPEEP